MEADISTDLTILQSCLNEMLDKVENDKHILKKFIAFQQDLFKLNDLSEIIAHVLPTLSDFFALDDISLTLVDTKKTIVDALSNSAYKNSNQLILLEDKLILSNALADGEYNGNYDNNIHQVFFPSRETPPLVILVIPLIRRENYLGSLNLASNNSHHFMHSTLMEFVQPLVTTLTQSLEASFNFAVVKQLELTQSLAVFNNREYLEQRLAEEFARSQTSVHCIACLMLEINIAKHAKIIQVEQMETYVMQTIAELVKPHLRRADVFSYYTSTKFAAMLVNVNDSVIVAIETRLQALISQHVFRFSGQLIKVSMLCGHATQVLKSATETKHPALAMQLLNSADENLLNVITAPPVKTVTTKKTPISRRKTSASQS